MAIFPLICEILALAFAVYLMGEAAIAALWPRALRCSLSGHPLAHAAIFVLWALIAFALACAISRAAMALA